MAKKTNSVYDINISNEGDIVLLSELAKNDGSNSFYSQTSPCIQILDSNLKLKIIIQVGERRYGSHGWNYMEKIIPANTGDGMLILANNYYDLKYEKYDSVNQRIDTITSFTYKATLMKCNNKGDSIWLRKYSIRENNVTTWRNAEYSYMHDIKSCPIGEGYLFGGSSFIDDAEERIGEAQYVPWLIKVDNEGCLIPGCDIVKNDNFELEHEIMLYPNPASDYIVLHHSNTENIHYQIVSTEGKVIDEFYSFLPGEQIIIPVYNYKPGYYFFKAENPNGYQNSKIFIKE